MGAQQYRIAEESTGDRWRNRGANRSSDPGYAGSRRTFIGRNHRHGVGLPQSEILGDWPSFDDGSGDYGQ